MTTDFSAKRPRFETAVIESEGLPAESSPSWGKELSDAQTPCANSAADGISPESDDWEEHTDEPILFSGPGRTPAAAPALTFGEDANGRDECPSSLPALRRREREREPHVSGSITTLHSLSQFDAIFSADPLPPNSAAPASAAPLLRLRAGESVLVLLHHGHVPMDAATAEFSPSRLFLLNLSALPAQDYEAPEWLRGGAPGGGASSRRGAASLPSLSSQIAHGTERVLRHVGRVLRVGEVLAPGDGDGDGDESDGDESAGGAGGSQASQASQSATQKRGRGEELALPAMVLWQAHGGPADERALCKGADVSSSHAFGRPLVVKQLTTVDQLHSLSLMAPVYTLEHLLRTVTRKALASRGTKDTRTLIYFGASWCPPCMRIVNVMPMMMKEDLPKNVVCTVKADMDLASPIFEFFGVEIIPTFMVLDNNKLCSAEDRAALLSGEPIPAERMKVARESLRQSELGRIQCSQRLLVRSFIEKHTKELSFDEDF